MRKLIYIAHPLSAPTEEGMEQNRHNAALWVAWAVEQGVAPIATWITLSRVWTEEKRELGLEVDRALVRRCDEMWLCGLRISLGMRVEEAAAREAGVPVVDMTGWEVPPHV